MKGTGIILKSILLATVLICLNAARSHAQSHVDIGATFTEDGLRSFFFSVGDYYKVPEREVVIIRDRGLPYYETPVVLYISRMANVAPAAVIDLRLSGRSWMDITLHYGLSPGIYYVPVRALPGPPYGRAYGYFKHKPQKEWRKIVLLDDDVVNLVNLKFTSEYYGYRPEDVIRMRSEGRDFVNINEHIRKEKRGKGRGDDNNDRDERSSERKHEGPDKGKGHGHKR